MSIDRFARRSATGLLYGLLASIVLFIDGSGSVIAGSAVTLQKSTSRFLEADTSTVENLVVREATGDSNSYHLTAPTAFVASPVAMMVSEHTQIRASGIEAQAGAAWFPPFNNKFPGGKGLTTTVTWELTQGFNLLSAGTFEKTGVPTEDEWYDWYPDEGSYPWSQSTSQLHNERLRMVFDIAAEAEAFDEGSSTIELGLSGSTYIWRNNWTPDGNWRQNMPVVRKKFRHVFVNSAPEAPAVQSGPPYVVWKDPATDRAMRPHSANFTVTLWGHNAARAGFRGNLQEHLQPTVVVAGPNVGIAPGGQLQLFGRTHEHFGLHPPEIIQVQPDFDPIRVIVLHSTWDMKKNQGKEYTRNVVLRPTILLCSQEDETTDDPPVAAPADSGGIAGSGKVPRRNVTSPGGRLFPFDAPGVDVPFEGDVRVRIHSLLLGNPLLELDASPDENDEWTCFDCVQSGDQVEFHYEFRDPFGRRYADTIALSVPDSLDTETPATLEIRQPRLEFVESDQDLDPVLSGNLYVLDLGGAPFGDLRPIPGVAVEDQVSGIGGTTDDTGQWEFEYLPGTTLHFDLVDSEGRYRSLHLPPTPPLTTHLMHREVAAGEWQDDRLITWMTPSFDESRLHIGSGRIRSRDGVLVSQVGAVSNFAMEEILSAVWQTLDGELLVDATVQPWGDAPLPGSDSIPTMFALVQPPASEKRSADFQAALSAVIASGGVRLLVTSMDGTEHVLDIALDQGSPTSVDSTPRGRRLDLRISPNPFNPVTTLSFDLAASAAVRLEIVGVDGRLVTTLIASRLEAGPHRAIWRGLDGRGAPVASGVYFAKLLAGDEVETQKLVLVR